MYKPPDKSVFAAVVYYLQRSVREMDQVLQSQYSMTPSDSESHIVTGLVFLANLIVRCQSENRDGYLAIVAKGWDDVFEIADEIKGILEELGAAVATSESKSEPTN